MPSPTPPDLDDFYQVFQATQPGGLDALDALDALPTVSLDPAPAPTAARLIQALAFYPNQLTHAEFAALLLVVENAASALANSGDYEALGSHRTLSQVEQTMQAWSRTTSVQGRPL